MNAHKKTFFKNQAESIISKMKGRGMDAYYCDNIDDAKKKVLELIGDGSKNVGYGGSMTIDECGLKNDIAAAYPQIIPT